MKIAKRIYIHFSDYYHVARARRNLAATSSIRRSLSTAVRLALLFGDEVYFPASSLFESIECRKLLQEFPEFRSHGIIKMSAGDQDLKTHLESKIISYNATSSAHFLKSYQQKHGIILPSYAQREGSSTRFITKEWFDILEESDFLTQIRGISEVNIVNTFEADWSRVPEQLNEQAFVPSHAAEILKRTGSSGNLEAVVSGPIERAYIDGYAMSLDAHLLLGVPHLSSVSLEGRLRTTHILDYRSLIRFLEHFQLAEPISEASSAALFHL